MLIRITGGDRPVAKLGNHTEILPDGSVHDVSDELGAAMIRDKWAAKAEKPKPAENKAIKPSENKGEAGAGADAADEKGAKK